MKPSIQVWSWFGLHFKNLVSEKVTWNHQFGFLKSQSWRVKKNYVKPSVWVTFSVKLAFVSEKIAIPVPQVLVSENLRETIRLGVIFIFLRRVELNFDFVITQPFNSTLNPILIPIMCVWSSLIIIVLLFCLYYALLYVKTIYGYGFLPAEKWDMVHMVFGAEMTIMSIFTNGSVVAYANNNSKVWKIWIVESAKKYFSGLIFFFHFATDFANTTLICKSPFTESDATIIALTFTTHQKKSPKQTFAKITLRYSTFSNEYKNFVQWW